MLNVERESMLGSTVGMTMVLLCIKASYLAQHGYHIRQVMGPRRKPCGTIDANGTIYTDNYLCVLPLASELLIERPSLETIMHYRRPPTSPWMRTMCGDSLAEFNPQYKQVLQALMHHPSPFHHRSLHPSNLMSNNG